MKAWVEEYKGTLQEFSGCQGLSLSSIPFLILHLPSLQQKLAPFFRLFRPYHSFSPGGKFSNVLST